MLVWLSTVLCFILRITIIERILFLAAWQILTNPEIWIRIIMIYIQNLFNLQCSVLIYLRWLNACSQCEPSVSLLLLRGPLLWLRALSPIRAWASSASSLWLQISCALCSASWSPAALNSLWSWHRFTLLKMLAEPAFLALRSASRHSEEGPATTEAGGVKGLVSIWGGRREQVKEGLPHSWISW